MTDETETTFVEDSPRRMLASAIGADDGQCAYIHPGIEERCTNPADAHSFIDFEGERQKVEMCHEHAREDVEPLPRPEQQPITDGGRDGYGLEAPHIDEEDVETGERIMESPLTGNTYLVTKWVESDDGFLAIQKEEITHCPECDRGIGKDGSHTLSCSFRGGKR